jgi:hypothetical protein
MTKTYTKTPLGGTAVRHRVILRDDPSSGDEIPMRQHAFLQEWVTNGVFTGMFRCGPIPFQKLSMRHDGAAWVIDMEAVEGEAIR